MMQVGTHYFTHLDADKTRAVLKHLAEGKDPAKLADTAPSAIDPIHHAKYGE